MFLELICIFLCDNLQNTSTSVERYGTKNTNISILLHKYMIMYFGVPGVLSLVYILRFKTSSVLSVLRNVSLQKFFSKYSIVATIIKIYQNLGISYLIYSEVYTFILRYLDNFAIISRIKTS